MPDSVRYQSWFTEPGTYAGNSNTMTGSKRAFFVGPTWTGSATS